MAARGSEDAPIGGDVARGAASARRPLRLGVFGGSFDPPHKSHARIAAAAVEQLGLDRLLVVPCADHPTKARRHTPAADRLALCALAFAGMPRVVVDRIEIDRGGRSYTVDTLRAVRERENADGHEVHVDLLIGSDNLAGLARWHEAEALPDLARLAIYPRQGFPVEVPTLGGRVPDHVVLACAPDAVNSTALREALARGERFLEDLDFEVEDVAVEHGLYDEERRAGEAGEADAGDEPGAGGA
jgi:nicotinate-nucleotide adenylyltransferase